MKKASSIIFIFLFILVGSACIPEKASEQPAQEPETIQEEPVSEETTVPEETKEPAQENGEWKISDYVREGRLIS